MRYTGPLQAKVTSLNQWVSQLSFASASASQYFMKKDPIKVVWGFLLWVLCVY